MTDKPSTNTFQARSLSLQVGLRGAPLASFRARAAAFLIDGSIGLLIAAAPAIWSGSKLKREGESISSMALELSIDLSSLIVFVVIVAYFGLATWAGRGATPGKRLLGIRVVSLVHPRLTLWHSIERALGYAASSLEAGFGFGQYFTHPNRQTVHDRIAETIVVDTRAARRAVRP